MTRELDELRALDWACYRAINGTPEGIKTVTLSRYSTDHAAASQLEDEIERRRLQDEYLTALWGEMGSDGSSDEEWVFQDIWLFIRATPEQRARAFLEATK